MVPCLKPVTIPITYFLKKTLVMETPQGAFAEHSLVTMHQDKCVIK